MSSVILTEKEKKFPLALILSRSQWMYLSTLGKTIFFTHSTDSNANLIRKQYEMYTHKYYFIWSSHAAVKLTHKIFNCKFSKQMKWFYSTKFFQSAWRNRKLIKILTLVIEVEYTVIHDFIINYNELTSCRSVCGRDFYAYLSLREKKGNEST